MRRLGPLQRLGIWGGAALFIGVIVLPILWALSTSFKIETMAVALPPRLIPDPVSLDAYRSVLTHRTFGLELFNSFLYAIGAVALAIAVGLPAGYAAARFQFRGKRTLMLAILATSMVPGVALLVPTYYLLDMLGLIDSRTVIIVISAARLAPQTVWFIQGFIEAVPTEIDEAALVDGATRPQILLKLVLPLIMPGIAATAVLGFITTWNDYITVAVFAPDTMSRTLQVALVNQIFDAVGVSWSYTMAFSIVASLPVVLVFIVAQRWFVAGLTAGTVKG
jgi:ABC-type glycerol-3-phosphate transport system permease component